MASNLDPGYDQALPPRYQALLLAIKSISTCGNLDDLFVRLKTELARVAHFDGIVITQIDQPSGKVIWRLAELNGRPLQNSLPKLVQEDQVLAWVFGQQQPLLFSSTQTDSRFSIAANSLGRTGFESLCLLPLTTARRSIGALALGSAQPGMYSAEDIGFLAVVADQVALAIDIALNLEELRQNRERLRLLLSVNNSIASNLDLHELLLAISASIRLALHCDASGVALPIPGTRQLMGYALDFPDSAGMINEQTPVPAIMQEVFDTGVPQLFSSSEPILLQPETVAEGITSLCQVPLISRGQTLGVLGVGRRESPALNQADLELLGEIGVQVAIAVQNALAYQQIDRLREQFARENVYLENEIRSELNFEEIVGRSEALNHVLRQVATVAPTDSTVVIYGDTGTGKELIARALHGLSSRNRKPFVKLNCAAIPAGLLESELFGHEKGAFTGAVSQRIGRFELSSEGTVFLDEIGELPLELQPKLLRVLQDGEFERLGSSRTIKTNARLIAATNRDLLAMVKEQKFRADLYYRVNVFPIHLPKLRDRRDDIPLLVRHFVQLYARRMNRNIQNIASETMRALTQYSWPGNIRELQNLMERAVILSPGPVLQVPLADLQDQSESVPAVETLEHSERKQILHALSAANGVIAGPNGAAARLGLKRSTLQARMAKLGIRRTRLAHESQF